MLNPGRAFSICGGVAALCWLGLAASLFVPDNLRAPIWAGTALGVPHVEASPLTRSSYHAREAARAANQGA